MLVDEEGNRLSDASKLRQGKRYLVARDAKDAQSIAAAVKAMGGMNLSVPASKAGQDSAVKKPTAAVKPAAKSALKSAEPKLAPETLVSYASEHL